MQLCEAQHNVKDVIRVVLVLIEDRSGAWLCV